MMQLLTAVLALASCSWRTGALVILKSQDLVVNENTKPGLQGKVPVLFVLNNRPGSARMRGTDPAWILRSMLGIDAKAIGCPEYCASYQNQSAVVVHVKVTCKCQSQSMMQGSENYVCLPKGVNLQHRHILDPVDRLSKHGGLEGLLQHDCSDRNYFDGYIVTNPEAKMRAQKAQPAAAAAVHTVYEHYSNFEERRKVFKNGQKEFLVGIAGKYKDPAFNGALSRSLAKLGQGVKVSVEQVMDISCDLSRATGHNKVGDGFALRIQKVDVGVVWHQSNDPLKKTEQGPLEDSAQRLVNFLSVGVPTIAHSKMSAHHDAMQGAQFSKIASDSQQLSGMVGNLLTNETLREAGGREALQIAERYSPKAVGKMYLKMFKAVLGAHSEPKMA